MLRRTPWIGRTESNLQKSRGTQRPLGALLVALTLATVACTTAEKTVSSTVPAGKDTCDEVIATVLPEGMRLVDRNLVPYSRTLLGVEAEYEGPGRNLSLVSGGYLDDILEAYDDLLPVGTREMLGGSASLLAGEYLDQSVRVALSADADMIVPCGTRAIVAVGFTQDEFEAILRGLTVRGR